MYGTQYTTSYKRLSGDLTTIQFLQLDVSEATPIVELIADNNPLEIITTGDVNNIFKSTIGTGASIKLLVEPLSVLNFFTSNPQEWMVKIYHGTTGGTLIWQGFINSEIYSENYSYSSDIDVPITVQCNDGMAVLDNVLYMDGVNNYTGTTTIANVINNILDKLAVTFILVYSNNDLEVRYPGAYCNIYKYLEINNENFINEKDEAMSCREVLDSIFGGLGLSMRFKSSLIYIIDPINLHTVGKGKTYSMSFNTENVTSFGGYLDISADEIDWFETNTMLDVVPSISEGIVKYDPYNFTNFNYNFNDEDNWYSGGTTWVDRTDWFNEQTILYDGWTETGAMNDYTNVGLREEEDSEPIFILMLLGLENYVNYTIPYSNISQDSNISLRLTMDVYVHTRENYANIWSDSTAQDIWQFKVPVSIKVGNQYWKGGNVWETTETGNYLQELLVREEGISLANVKDSRINDDWHTGIMEIPLGASAGGTLIQGNIRINIYDNDVKNEGWILSQVFPDGSQQYVEMVLIRDIKIEIINSTTGEVIRNLGVENKGKNVTNLTGKDAFTINTTTGTGLCGCSRGAFKTDEQAIAGQNISGLYRDSDSGATYTTNEFILQNFISQYQQPRYKLSGVLDAKDYGVTLDMKLIQDLTYLPDTSFYIVSNIYNDADESASVEMVEIIENREEIT